MSTVLVVDDDYDVATFIEMNLRIEGFDVLVAHDGAEALEMISSTLPDLALVDVMMPKIDGIEVVRRLRSTAATASLPVIMLTAKSLPSDKVVGLTAGADDYMVKPFALDELLARLRALLRRTLSGPDAAQQLKFSDLVLDLGTREVWRGTRPISLTRTEFHLLELLMRHPRQVLERNQILEEVWGYDFPTTANSLEVYVGYLRRKLETDGESRLIHTVRGVGYSLRELPT
jgi:two-component system response regulator MprA